MNSITNKTEAYDYLYSVHNNLCLKNEELYKQASSFFTNKQLKCLDYTPDFIINNCFKHTAKTIGVCDCVTNLP